MKKTFASSVKYYFSLLLLLSVSFAIYAESRVLPPVVDNSTYPGGSAYSAATPSSANAMYEVLGRLEQLQHEVQQLRGIVEEQSQTIVDLKKRQGNIYSDLDQRLQALAGVGAQNNVVFDSMNQTSQSVANSTLTDSATGQNVVEYPVPVKDDLKVGPKAVNAVPEVSLKNQKQLYQTAYETLRNGHNTRAIAEFKALLTEFPDGEYADNAQYWLGEAYKVNQDFNSAKAAFSKVITHFGGSPKVADALLKLGYIELEQNNMAKARDYLTQVTVSHPGTTAAHLAAKKLMQLETMQP